LAIDTQPFRAGLKFGLSALRASHPWRFLQCYFFLNLPTGWPTAPHDKNSTSGAVDPTQAQKQGLNGAPSVRCWWNKVVILRLQGNRLLIESTQQVPPLRCASVGMTILLGHQHPNSIPKSQHPNTQTPKHPNTQTELSSRPKRSAAEGPAVSFSLTNAGCPLAPISCGGSWR
jgi:hypothetical protein